MKVGIFSNSPSFVIEIMKSYESKIVFVVSDSHIVNEKFLTMNSASTIFFKYSEYESYNKLLTSIDILFCYDFCILPRTVINKPKIGSVNFHPATLPDFAGRYPWPMLVESKSKSSAITAHLMLEKPDSGKVIQSRSYPLYKEDYYKDWKDRTEREVISLASNMLTQRLLSMKIKLFSHLKFKTITINPASSFSSRKVLRPDLEHLYDVIRINSDLGGTKLYTDTGKVIKIFKVSKIGPQLLEDTSNFNDTDIYYLKFKNKPCISINLKCLEITDYDGDLPQNFTILKYI